MAPPHFLKQAGLYSCFPSLSFCRRNRCVGCKPVLPQRERVALFASPTLLVFRTRRALFLLVAEHNLPTHQGDAADPRLCYFHSGGSEGEGHSPCANPFTSVLLFFCREPHTFPPNLVPYWPRLFGHPLLLRESPCVCWCREK